MEIGLFVLWLFLDKLIISLLQPEFLWSFTYCCDLYLYAYLQHEIRNELRN